MQLVTYATQKIIELYPPEIRAQIEPELPSLMLDAASLALEVMRAEQDKILFHEAAQQIRFPLLARVHFGIQDLLQSRIPKELREGFRVFARQADQTDLEPLRRSLFHEAARRGEPQAALLRFFIYEFLRADLLIATWDEPAFEVLGVLERIEDQAQKLLDELLDLKEMHEEEVRPLQLVAAEFFVHAFRDAETAQRVLTGSEESIDIIERMIEATRTIRTLDAPDAAVARAEVFEEEMGSQQLADRYPHHFATANAVDLRRSRLRKALSQGNVAVHKDRFIDLILEELEQEEE